MTRISHPGNDRRRFRTFSCRGRPAEGGFVLLDALLCLFITASAVLLLRGGLETLGSLAAGRIAAAVELVGERNFLAGRPAGGPEFAGGMAGDD